VHVLDIKFAEFEKCSLAVLKLWKCVILVVVVLALLICFNGKIHIDVKNRLAEVVSI